MATYYVNQNGDNSDGTTLAKGKTTITAGLALLTAGGSDTLLINDGTYDEGIANSSVKNGQDSSNRHTIQAINSRQVVVKPSSVTRCVFSQTSVINIGNKSFLTFDGIVFDGNLVCINVVRFQGSSSGAATTYIDFDDCIIRNGAGTFSDTGSSIVASVTADLSTFSDIRIANSEIHTIQAGNSCLSFDADTVTIEDNHIHDCGRLGVSTHHVPTSGWIVRRNLIEDTNAACIGEMAGSNQLIYNNLLVRCSGGPRGGGVAGVYAMADMTITNPNTGGAPSGIKFYNNTSYDSDATNGCFGSYAGSSHEFKNNICFGGVADDIDSTTGTTFLTNRCATGCTTTDDPAFFDAPNGDYRLTASTPASIKSSGTDLSATFTTDYVNTTRDTWGLGAYTYVDIVPPNPDPVIHRGRLH